MQVKMYPDCKLFTFNRQTLEFGTVEPEFVQTGTFWYMNRYWVCYFIPNQEHIIVVQAINIKKAAAKMISLLPIIKKTAPISEAV